MSRRFLFRLAIIAETVCFAATALLLAVVMALPAENRRPWLEKAYATGMIAAIGAFTIAAMGAAVFVARLYRLRANRQFQFSLRTLLVLATAAPVALWVTSWQCQDVYQWLALLVWAGMVFLLLKR